MWKLLKLATMLCILLLNIIVIEAGTVQLVMYGEDPVLGSITYEDKSKVIIKKSDGNTRIISRSKIKEIIYRYDLPDVSLAAQVAKKNGNVQFKNSKDKSSPKPGSEDFIPSLPKLGKGRNSKLWQNGRVGLLTGFNIPLGAYGDLFSNGFTAAFSYDHGLDFIVGKRRAWMPAVHAEAAYQYYDNAPNSIKGTQWLVGPIWHYSPFRSFAGSFTASLLPGVSLLDVGSASAQLTTSQFTFASTVGYEYPFGQTLLMYNLRYGLISDPSASLSYLSFSVGLSRPL